MYSIVIAIILFIISIWLINLESRKEPSAHNAWSLLTAILMVIIGTAITLHWLIMVFL